MPRQLRIEYAGAMYHLMSRGDRREKIFLNDVDRDDFLKTLAEASLKDIASRAGLGSSKSANATLHRWMQHHGPTGCDRNSGAEGLRL